MTFLVTGARGGVARAVITRLTEAGHAVRTASASPDAGADVVLDINDPASLDAALDGVAGAFVYAFHGGGQNFADAAKRVGVPKLAMLSSIAAAFPSNPIGDNHLRTERPLQDTGIPLAILRPGAFATNALGWAPGIREDRRALVAFPNIQMNPIHEGDMADVAVAALTGDLTGIVPLGGPESLPQYRQVELIGEALGEKIEIVELTLEQARETLYPPVFEMWSKMDDSPAPTGPLSQDVTGVPSRSFAQWAADHVADYRG
ncbi:nucleotide-diphosphate-sugar epimerase [Actinorhabdospora filicis]|uniref:Nucleotide-diphosphate-sugar epimerase n=1 Tax=Actinorhabdospora filicis TaxID=1785913 RepID=A0A9W6SHF6_9ACTN|nr:NAD(P)H-binding protein [Actinorhabdospora filicis]GLZ75526.1 nucleotide-diphosphate-sugar epimerase [Actinorhabdospora filicis]